MFELKMNKINLFRSTISVKNYLRCKSSLGLWDQDVNTQIKEEIEKHWYQEVRQRPVEDQKKDPYYVLSMFPYPSGNLHMGHVRVYTLSDTIARFQRLNGKNVIHPMGWDAFGLPAENAAIEHKILPQKWTTTNIENMKKQLLKLGFTFDWDKEFSTCDPNYYKWTQYIFLKLYEKGIAYQQKASVNWDPVDKTVLADEQVNDAGCSWRSGAKVEKKILKQWFLRTTKYSKELYDGLNTLDNWRDIIKLQRNWIGECDGVVVTFKIKIDDKNISLDVWTSEAFKFIYGEFLTISSSNIILLELSETQRNNLKAINPLTNSEIPIYISDSAKYPEGREVYIACPSISDDDNLLATSLNVSVKNQHIDIDIEEENKNAINLALQKSIGGYLASSKLRDWLISRQRYWGTPIPIINCDKCGAVPVPVEELPVTLPLHISNYSKDQTLNNISEWVNCKCPKCQCDSKRETDTMDTFVDSSWYYYRFLDPHNKTKPFDKEKLINKVPVHLYIGGKEHATLHLYYARFMSYFLNSLGWTPCKEPFEQLLVQGMVMGQSYKLKTSGKYVPPDQVEKIQNTYKHKITGEPVHVQWEKMSKSKYNGENPERLLSVYGIDTTRLLILADVAPETSRNWSEATFPGTLKWQHRLWITMRDFLQSRNNILQNGIKVLSNDELSRYEKKFWEDRNKCIASATFHYKHTKQLSIAIKALQTLSGSLRENRVPPFIVAKSKEFELSLATLIIMLSPIAPHFAYEMWAGFVNAPGRISESSHLINWDNNVMGQKWPIIDEDYPISVACKVDGVKRCIIKIKNIEKYNHQEILNIALKQEELSVVVKRGIERSNYKLFPGCHGSLNIFTVKKKKDDKEITCN